MKIIKIIIIAIMTVMCVLSNELTHAKAKEIPAGEVTEKKAEKKSGTKKVEETTLAVSNSTKKSPVKQVPPTRARQSSSKKAITPAINNKLEAKADTENKITVADSDKLKSIEELSIKLADEVNKKSDEAIAVIPEETIPEIAEDDVHSVLAIAQEYANKSKVADVGNKELPSENLLALKSSKMAPAEKMSVAVIGLTLVALVTCFFFIKRKGNPFVRKSINNSINIIQVASIGIKKSVVDMEWNKSRLLIGVSDQGIYVLDRIREDATQNKIETTQLLSEAKISNSLSKKEPNEAYVEDSVNQVSDFEKIVSDRVKSQLNEDSLKEVMQPSKIMTEAHSTKMEQAKKPTDSPISLRIKEKIGAMNSTHQKDEITLKSGFKKWQALKDIKKMDKQSTFSKRDEKMIVDYDASSGFSSSRDEA